MKRRPLGSRSSTSGSLPVQPGVPIKPFSPEELEREERRNKEALQRGDSFLELLEQYKRSGDELLRFDGVVYWISREPVIGMAAPELIRHFVECVKIGSFPIVGTGFVEEPQRSVVRDLFDLDNFSGFTLQPGESYPLHPSVLTVTMMALLMYARRTVWCQWIAGQGWPIPHVLQYAPTIEYASPSTPAEPASEPAAEPAEPPFEGDAEGPPEAPADAQNEPISVIRSLGGKDLQALYDARVTPEYAPTFPEDRAWAREQGLTLEVVEALRKKNLDPRLHGRGRRPKNPRTNPRESPRKTPV